MSITRRERRLRKGLAVLKSDGICVICGRSVDLDALWGSKLGPLMIRVNEDPPQYEELGTNNREIGHGLCVRAISKMPGLQGYKTLVVPPHIKADLAALVRSSETHTRSPA